MLDSVADAVVALGTDWRIKYANARALAMARMASECLLGNSIWELFPELAGSSAEREFRRSMQNRVHTRFEYWYAPYDLWSEVETYPAPDGLAVFLRDISERKRVTEERDRLNAELRREQERLRLSEERFRVALRGSPIVVFNQDTNLEYTWVHNPPQEFQNIDWIGRTDEVTGEATEALLALKREVLRTGNPVSRELMIPADGRRRYHHFQIEALRGPDGAITGITGSATDTTAHHDAQERIQQQEELLRTVIDAIPGLVAYVDPECRYRFANARYLEWLGRSGSELQGKTIEQAFGREMYEAIRPQIERGLRGESVSYVLHHHYPDKERWVLATYVPHLTSTGQVQGLVIFVQDVTDAHEADEELRRSEEKYRFLANALPQLVWVADGRGHTEFLNDYWYEYTGATREEGVAAWDRLVPLEDAAAVRTVWDEATSAQTPFDVEHRLRRADGALRWHLARIKPVRDAEGELVQWIGTSLDIHDRKNSELELAQARRDLSEILESITESFIAVDRDWRFVYVNQRVADVVGLKREELIGRNMWEVAPESVNSAFFPNYHRVMRERIPLHFEMPYPPDQWFDVYAHPTETGMSAYVVDKTQQRRTEEALRQKAKLESIGLLAGGVAHDFNNLLVGILGSASLAQEMIEPARPEYELIRLIADSAERAAHLTRQMLTYAGKSKPDKQPVDLNRIVIDTMQLLHSMVPTGVRVTTDLERDLPPFSGDPGQIQQLVMNLMTNAIEAIPKNTAGRIEVQTRLCRIPSECPIGIDVLAPGEFIELMVRDTGAGMTESVLDRIFDPFFTTKFTGRGLGLAAVRGIIRNHEGGIQVESAAGEGTRFRILLRCTESVPAKAGTIATAMQGTGVVLVIDDEAPVRLTCERILMRHGFGVVTASDGDEGIEKFRKGQFVAVLLDLSMPDQSGFDVLREVAKERSSVPVILSSGHSQKDLEADLRRFPTVRFLQKPYKTEDLLRALQNAIG